MFRKKPREARPRRNASRKPPEKPLKPVKSIQMVIQMRGKAGITYSKLSTISRVDGSYLRRLETGVSRNPSRDTLISLLEALVDYTKLFTAKDVDRVLNVAGFAPAPLRH